MTIPLTQSLTIRLFAAARAQLNQDQVTVEFPANGSVRELREQLAATHPELNSILAHSRFAVNQDYAADDASIPANAEVALIPPVSGG